MQILYGASVPVDKGKEKLPEIWSTDGWEETEKREEGEQFIPARYL
jgi:hypothetical protein